MSPQEITVLSEREWKDFAESYPWKEIVEFIDERIGELRETLENPLTPEPLLRAAQGAIGELKTLRDIPHGFIASEHIRLNDREQEDGN